MDATPTILKVNAGSTNLEAHSKIVASELDIPIGTLYPIGNHPSHIANTISNTRPIQNEGADCRM